MGSLTKANSLMLQMCDANWGPQELASTQAVHCNWMQMHMQTWYQQEVIPAKSTSLWLHITSRRQQSGKGLQTMCSML